MYPVPDISAVLDDQPVQRIEEVAGLYFRSIRLELGHSVPQHAHDHRHATLVGSGRAKGWADGVYLGERGPGEAFEIEAGSSHIFQASEPNTLLICVHDIQSAESVKRKGI